MSKLSFLKDITHRDGEGSSKKLWYNVACGAATVIMLWEAFQLPSAYGMDDWAFIWLFGVFLLSVGGFEVLLQVVRLIKGVPDANNTATSKQLAVDIKGDRGCCGGSSVVVGVCSQPQEN